MDYLSFLWGAAVSAVALLTAYLLQRGPFVLRFQMDEAVQRAVKRWREAAPGRELVMPDAADLLVWLMDRLEETQAQLHDAEMLAEGRATEINFMTSVLADPVSVHRNMLAGRIARLDRASILHIYTDIRDELDTLAKREVELEAAVAGLLADNGQLVDRAEAAEQVAAERADKVDGLTADLDAALDVLARRVNGEADLASAGEWLRLNYPIKVADFAWASTPVEGVVVKPQEPEQEGDPCPYCGGGVVEKHDGEGCSCHINPPCGYCTSSHFACDECGWEGGRP